MHAATTGSLLAYAYSHSGGKATTGSLPAQNGVLLEVPNVGLFLRTSAKLSALPSFRARKFVVPCAKFMRNISLRALFLLNFDALILAAALKKCCFLRILQRFAPHSTLTRRFFAFAMSPLGDTSVRLRFTRAVSSACAVPLPQLTATGLRTPRPGINVVPSLSPSAIAGSAGVGCRACVHDAAAEGSMTIRAKNPPLGSGMWWFPPVPLWRVGPPPGSGGFTQVPPNVGLPQRLWLGRAPWRGGAGFTKPWLG